MNVCPMSLRCLLASLIRLISCDRSRNIPDLQRSRSILDAHSCTHTARQRPLANGHTAHAQTWHTQTPLKAPSCVPCLLAHIATPILTSLWTFGTSHARPNQESAQDQIPIQPGRRRATNAGLKCRVVVDTVAGSWRCYQEKEVKENRNFRHRILPPQTFKTCRGCQLDLRCFL